jgi:hypothetical protein
MEDPRHKKPLCSDTEVKDFLLVEYQTASTQYMHSVDLGVTFVKNVLWLNALLLAISGAALQYHLAVGISTFIMCICSFGGLVIAIYIASVVNNYGLQLQGSLVRCIELERMFGGDLYSRLDRNSRHGRKSPSSLSGVYLICAFFGVIWLLIGLIVLMSPDIILTATGKT